MGTEEVEVGADEREDGTHVAELFKAVDERMWMRQFSMETVKQHHARGSTRRLLSIISEATAAMESRYSVEMCFRPADSSPNCTEAMHHGIASPIAQTACDVGVLDIVGQRLAGRHGAFRTLSDSLPKVQSGGQE